MANTEPFVLAMQASSEGLEPGRERPVRAGDRQAFEAGERHPARQAGRVRVRASGGEVAGLEAQALDDPKLEGPVDLEAYLQQVTA